MACSSFWSSCSVRSLLSVPHDSYVILWTLPNKTFGSSCVKYFCCLKQPEILNCGRNGFNWHKSFETLRTCVKPPLLTENSVTYNSAQKASVKTVTGKPYVRLKPCFRTYFSATLLTNRCQILKSSDSTKYWESFKKNHSIRCCSRCTFVDRKIPPGFRTHPPWRLLFFGTDDFAVASLKALNENRMDQHLCVVETLEVVSNKGNTAVRSYANEAGLVVHDWPIQTWTGRFDAGVLASFGHLIPNRIIHMFPYGIVNVHPSLLPRWRGASPIIHSILSGDSVTGISLMEIRPKHFDIGPLLMQKEVPVPRRCTSKQLSQILAPLGASMIIQALYDLPRLERLEIEQQYRGVTYAHKLTPDMAFVDWVNHTTDEIDRLYRGISEILPLRSQWKNSNVKLLEMVPIEQLEGNDVEIAVIKHFQAPSSSLPAGTPFYDKYRNLLLIKCKDGWVGFQKIVHRKTLDALAFYNGYLSKKENRGVTFKSIQSELDEKIGSEKMHQRNM